MKKASIFIMMLYACIFSSTITSQAQVSIKVFDTLTYYDGYATVVSTPTPPTGIFRLRNDLYTRKLTSSELSSIGSTLEMKVTIGALCDNYDRIGSVNLALVPKGQTSYNTDSVKKIEIGRYITPFMNKNVQPTSVPYTYDVTNLVSIFKESSLVANYDFWIELELFGVPYAANTEVAGCSGRNDVFYGSLEFTTNSTTVAAQTNNVLVPVVFKSNFNNYQTGATDTIGKTTKSFTINVPQNLTDAALVLITSNHGANSGGEEYNRRNHYVYFDNSLVLTYKPGRTSCEPFRQYNTQANGIYGSSVKSDATWQSFSNWCPGDVISTREIHLGALTSGNHTFLINVPDATFAAGQGNFPLSLYLQGKTSGTLSVTDLSKGTFQIYPNPASNQLHIKNSNFKKIQSLLIYDAVGKLVYQSNESFTESDINLQASVQVYIY